METSEFELSFDSLDSNQVDMQHYADESDGEPPTDQIGDTITVIKKR